MIGQEDPDKEFKSAAYRAARAEIAEEKEVYVVGDYAHFLPMNFAKFCIENRIAPDVAVLEWEKSVEYRRFVNKQLLSQIVGSVSIAPEKLSTYMAMFKTLLGFSPLRDGIGGIENGKS